LLQSEKVTEDDSAFVRHVTKRKLEAHNRKGTMALSLRETPREDPFSGVVPVETRRPAEDRDVGRFRTCLGLEQCIQVIPDHRRRHAAISAQMAALLDRMDWSRLHVRGIARSTQHHEPATN
jgi:hypothetical protein